MVFEVVVVVKAETPHTVDVDVDDTTPLSQGGGGVLALVPNDNTRKIKLAAIEHFWMMNDGITK